MLEFSQYLISEPLPEVVRALSDSTLSPEQNRDDVNTLVMNFVVKFLSAYLDKEVEIVKDTSAQIEAIMRAIKVPDSKEDIAARHMRVMNREFVNNGAFPINCVLDLHATAAIVKEILFGGGFDTQGTFCGVDFGSGTGILTLAACIAAQRAQVQKILMFGIEGHQQTVVHSQRALEYGMKGIEVPMMWGIRKLDIRHPNIMNIFDGYPLSYWISETISTATPPLIIEENTVQIPKTEEVMYRVAIDESGDPFPIVFTNAAKARPRLLQDIRDGKTAMFPDIVNGRYQPAMDMEPTIQLRTGRRREPIRLTDIGEEFENYQTLISSSFERRFTDYKDLISSPSSKE